MNLLLGFICSLTALVALAWPQPRADQSGSAPALKNPFDSQLDAEVGNRLFQTHCSYCHGAYGEGGRGADLTSGEFRYGGTDNALFTTVRNGIEGSEMGPVRASDDEVWRMVAFVKRLSTVNTLRTATGNVAAGRIVYLGKGGCASCHTINKQGGIVGPDLTDIGQKRGHRFLEESLLKPEADLPLVYRGVRVVSQTGQTVSGVRLNEDDISIQLRDFSGNPRSFLKSKLREIRRDNPSVMPAYGTILTKKEIDDVVAYLSSLRGAP